MEEKIYKIRDKSTGLFFQGKANSMWSVTKKGKTWTREYDAKRTLKTLINLHKSGIKITISNVDLNNLEVIEYKLSFSKICNLN